VDARRIDWGRVPPERRGVWGRWLYVMRGERSQAAIRELMADLGQPISESYYSELETGNKKPKEPYTSVLIRLHGSDPEEWDDPWAAPRQAEDTSDLVAVIRAQTEAISDLAAAIREDRDRVSPEGLRLFLEQLRSEGLLLTPDIPASSDVTQRPVEAVGK
jgi:hypothetical protein